MDYYQKPALFAIFLSFVPQILTMYSEIRKTKVGQTNKNSSFIKFCLIINPDHQGFSFADGTGVY